MNRKLFGLFSGTHLTLLGMAALFVPGVLHAVPSFTNVAIEDITTGNRATVDPGKRLYVNDPVGNYARTPSNLVRAFLIFGNGCNQAGSTYAVPAGKALIITSVTFYIAKIDGAQNGAGGSLWSNTGCTNVVALGVTSQYETTLNQDFETGLPIPAGSVLATNGSNGTGNILVSGYLIPASTLPSAGSAEAKAQITAPPDAGAVARGLR